MMRQPAMTEPLFPLLGLSRLRMGTDGTGVTTLIAGAGCPLTCRWCINARKPDDLYFRATGGGVTFGGGESLLHAAFIRRFRELCPGEWQICAETSLAVPTESISLAAEAADFFLVDCKDTNPDIYRRYTGGEEALMEKNLRFLLNAVGSERILVRVPYIPEYNTREDQQRSTEKLKALGVTKLDLFDYVIRCE